MDSRLRIFAAIRGSWSFEISDPTDAAKLVPANSSRGQCAVTSPGYEPK